MLPVRRDLQVVVGELVGLDDGVIERRGRTAFAGELGGDALKDFGRQMRVHQDGQLGLAEHVNEARRDDHAVRVNGALGLRRAQKADGGDASVANADVAGVPGRAGAVNDVAVADDEVVRGGGGLGAGGRED